MSKNRHHVILVCLDLLKHPYSGMGRVSIDFSNELMKRANENLSFLVPRQFISEFRWEKVVELNWKRKIFSKYLRHVEVCHVLHQLPKFSFKKAPKVVLTIHDLNFLYVKNKRKQLKYKRRVQRAINQSNYICFISEYAQSDCIKNMKMPDHVKTKVIYNGVGQLEFTSLKPEWCTSNEFIFSIGQFLNKKNFHVLIPFLKLLPEGISLIIAGQNQTSYGDLLKQKIKEMGMENRVILPGPINETEKSYLYHHCKAFVFPSLAEGFGLPVIEAMKCNKPVFCSDKTSLKEIGADYAFFWTEFDSTKMLEVYKKGMVHFYNDSDYRNRQLQYANSYTWKKNVDEYLKVYKELQTK